MDVRSENYEQDQYWLTIPEEVLFFNDTVVNLKYNELEEGKADEERDTKGTPAATTKKSKKEQEKEDHDLACKLVGLVDVDPQEFNRKAIRQWTKELLNACAELLGSSTSFENVLKKRLRVQNYLHLAYLREKNRKKKAKRQEDSGAISGTTPSLNVPVIVRLGVLTLFPLIESLSQIKDANYQKLCAKTLQVVIDVLSSIPTLALHDEPTDCLDAFKDFIYNLVASYNFQIDTEQKAQAAIALIGMAISRGYAQHLLQVVDVLFQVHQRHSASETMKDHDPTLKIGHFLRQLAEYGKDKEFPLLATFALDNTWYIISQTAQNKQTLSLPASKSIPLPSSNHNGSNNSKKSASIACDGEYLYLWTRGQGLKKLGTGKRGTIQGHVYCQNSNYRTDDDVASLALVANKLYYVSAGVGLPKSEKQISGQLTQVQQRQEQQQQQRPESEQFESLSSALQPISQLYSLDAPSTFVLSPFSNVDPSLISTNNMQSVVAFSSDSNLPARRLISLRAPQATELSRHPPESTGLSSSSSQSKKPQYPVVAVLNIDTLKEEMHLKLLSSACDPQECALLTDGRYLYLIAKKKQQQQQAQQAQPLPQQQPQQQPSIQLQSQSQPPPSLSFASSQDILQPSEFIPISDMPPPELSNELLESLEQQGTDYERQFVQDETANRFDVNRSSDSSSESESGDATDFEDNQQGESEEGNAEEEEEDYRAPRRQRILFERAQSSGSAAELTESASALLRREKIMVEQYDPLHLLGGKPKDVVKYKQEDEDLEDEDVPSVELTPIRQFELKEISIASQNRSLSMFSSYRSAFSLMNREQKDYVSGHDYSSTVITMQKATFYTNGYHLIAMLPGTNSSSRKATTIEKFCVFSMVDGSFIEECSFENELKLRFGVAACYDLKNNLIWTYCPHFCQVKAWLNLGLTPAYEFPHSDGDVVMVDAQTKSAHSSGIGNNTNVTSADHSSEFLPKAPKYAPEFMLERNTLLSQGKDKDSKQVDSFLPLDTILIIMGHMDRLARQHPAYHTSHIIDDTIESFGNKIQHHFAVEPSAKVLKFLYTIVTHALECIAKEPTTHELMGYIILASLRLLRVNIHEIVASSKGVAHSFEDAGFEDKGQSLLAEIRQLLLSFIEKPPLSNIPTLSAMIRTEACSLVTAAFTVLFPQPMLQISFILEAMAQENKSEGMKCLLQLLLSELSQWYRISEILSEDQPNKEEKDQPPAEKSKSQTKEKAKERDLPVNALALKFIAALVEYATEEVRSTLRQLENQRPPLIASYKLTPAVRLLLALQREIVSGIFGRNFLFEFCGYVVTNIIQLVQEFGTKYLALVRDKDTSPTSTTNALATLLRCSIMGVVFSSLTTALSRRSHLREMSFVAQLLPKYMNLFKEIDSLNKLQPLVVDADAKYLRQILPRKEKKIVVETKHPYAMERYTETVKIPGAEALCLKFDPKCCTADQASDRLQLFADPALEKPIIKDKNPVIFSGSNFPTEPLIIEGDTVTFVFTSSPNSESSKQSARRWGFRCVISDVTQQRHEARHLFLELENTVAILAAKYAVALVEGEPPNEREKQLAPWLETRLLNGGLEELQLASQRTASLPLTATEINNTNVPAPMIITGSSSEDINKAFLDDFLEERGEAAKFYEWLKAQNKNRPILPPQGKKIVERAERYVIAAMLRHMGLITEAQTFAIACAKNSPLPSDSQAKFRLLSMKSTQVVVWLANRGQIQKEWLVAVKEKPTNATVFDSYKGKPKQLEQLCEMKGVEFDLMDTNETIKKLFNKLQEEIAQLEKEEREKSQQQAFPPPLSSVNIPTTSSASSSMTTLRNTNPFEIIAQPVIERAKLLLRMVPSMRRVRHPSADSANPFAIHRDRSFLGEASNAAKASNDRFARFRQSHSLVGTKDQNEIEFFGGTEPSHPLSRSLTFYYPQTDVEVAKERKKAREEQKSKDFSRRVKELRKWLQAYKSWKEWQENALLLHTKPEEKLPPNSLLQSIVQFVQSSINVKELERIFRLHVSRAKTRVQGLTFLCQMLSFCSFDSVRQQVLGSIGRPLCDGGHYLDNVQTCGKELAQTVAEAFSALFDQMTNIIRDPSIDMTSRLLALNVCGMAFQDYDTHLLTKAKIFPLLRQIISEKPKLVPLKSISSVRTEDKKETAVTKDTEGHRQDITEGDKKIQEDEDVVQELQRQRTLRSCAWTAFRLLATQCMSWMMNDDVPSSNLVDKNAISKLHDQIFDLMCEELKRIAEQSKTTNPSKQTQVIEDGEQCYQLLSLLYLLGTSSSARLKYLCRKENISNLVTLLGTNTAPRSQRLVLRLFRRLLPFQQESVDNFVELFLSEIGKLMFQRKYSDETQRIGTSTMVATTTTTTAEKKETQEAKEMKSKQSDRMEVESPLLDDNKSTKESLQKTVETEDTDNVSENGDDESRGDKTKGREYALYLNYWPSEHKRFLDIFSGIVGTELLGSSLPSQNLDLGGRSAQQYKETRVQEILNELSNNGSALIKTGKEDQCKRLAQLLCSHGATVTLTQIKKASDKSSETNRNQLNKTLYPIFWMNGHAAESLAAEYISLLRHLMRCTHHSPWSNAISSTLLNYLLPLSELISELINNPKELSNEELMKKHVPHSLAALCVLGGFEDFIRVGAKAASVAPDDIRRLGTVIDYSQWASETEMVFDSEELKQLHKIDVEHLLPVSDAPVDSPAAVSIAQKLVPLLLQLVQATSVYVNANNQKGRTENNKNTNVNNVEKLSKQSLWLLTEVNMRSLAALSNLTTIPSVVSLLLEMSASEKFNVLIEMAKSCDPSFRTEQLERKHTLLQHCLWDLLTYPDQRDNTPQQTMAAILPYYPHANKVTFLPTCFERSSKSQGLIFIGDDMRTVESSGFVPLGAQLTASRGLSTTHSGRQSGSSRYNQNAEVLVVGNAVIPFSQIPEYYFEITIEGLESGSSNIISIGLCPENQTIWGPGSYRYQANRQKAYYDKDKLFQEPYGKEYARVKAVVGCGWDSGRKVIYFTVDGEELAAAFSNVHFTNERLVPAVGLGKGVRVRVNFGQEPFKYKLLSTVTDEAQRKELENRRKSAYEAEKIRRQKEKEKDEAELREKIKRLAEIIHRPEAVARKILELNDYDLNKASLWYFDKDSGTFDEKIETEEPKEKEKEKEKEKPLENVKDIGNEGTESQQEEKNDKMEIEGSDEIPPENSYNTTLAQSYYLDDINTVFISEEKKQPEVHISPEWESRIIPTVQMFMEKDRFDSLSVNDFVQQIRQALAAGNEEKAAEIVRTICRDVSRTILGNVTKQSKTASTPSLKLDQIKVGMILEVTRSESSETNQVANKLWLKEMDHIMGQRGVVKSIDYKENLVLLQFYNAELAQYEEWWLPLQILNKPDKPPMYRPYQSIRSIDQLTQMIVETEAKLANNYARRVALTILEYTAFSRLENAACFLKLVTAEYLSAIEVFNNSRLLLQDVLHSIENEDPQCPALLMNRLTHKLRNYIQDPINSERIPEFVALLTKLSLESLSATAFFTSKYTVTVASQEHQETPVSNSIRTKSLSSRSQFQQRQAETTSSSSQGLIRKVSIDSAYSLLVLFDRAVNFATNNNSKLQFFYDEECTEIIRTFSDKNLLSPVLIPRNTFFVKFTTKQPGQYKYKFVVIPITLDFGLARWIIEFLMDNMTSLKLDFVSTYNALVDFAYRCRMPSLFKQMAIYLLAEMTTRLRYMGESGYTILSTLPHQRLLKLKQEMISQYDIEKKRSGLFSSYLQVLVELNIAQKLYEVEISSSKVSVQKTVEVGSMQDRHDPEIATLMNTNLAEESATREREVAQNESKSVEQEQPAVTSAVTESASSSTTAKLQSVNPEIELPPEAVDDPELAEAIKVSLEEAKKHKIEEQKAETTKKTEEDTKQKIEEENKQIPESEAKETAGDAMTTMMMTTTTTTRASQTQESQPEDTKEKRGEAKSEETEPQKDSEMMTEDDPEVRLALEISKAVMAEASKESLQPPEKKDDKTEPKLEKKTERLAPKSSTVPLPPPRRSVRMFEDVPPTQRPIRAMEPTWFTQAVAVIEILDCLARRVPTNKHQNKVLADLVTRAWQETRKDHITNKILVINNLPQVPAAKQSELLFVLQELVEEHANIVKESWFLPIDQQTQKTKTFAFVELQNSDKIRNVINKLKGYRLKVPKITGDKSVHNLKLACLKDMARTNPQVVEYLRAQLIDPTTKQLTKRASQMFTEIFSRYAVAPIVSSAVQKTSRVQGDDVVSPSSTLNGVMGPEQWDAFQLTCTGQKMSADLMKYAMENYETKTITALVPIPCIPDVKMSDVLSEGTTPLPINNTNTAKEPLLVAVETSSSPPPQCTFVQKEVKGTTLKGFLDLYCRQSDDNPIVTWDELQKLGFDLHLLPTSFPNVDDAIRAITEESKVNSILVDEELVRYAEQLYAECDLNSPLFLTPAHIGPIANDTHVAQQYPKLAKFDLRTVRLRFEILKQFNSKLPNVLPLINLQGFGLLAKQLSRCRGLIFHSVKMQYICDVLDKTSVQASQPVVVIDRFKLAARKEKNPSPVLDDEYILKNTTFGIAFSQLKQVDPNLFKQKKPSGAEPHLAIKIDFKGEHVEGEGGPYRQFFTDVSKELRNILPLLIPCPNAQAKVGKNRDKYIINPSCNSRVYLKMYRFLGQLMGMAFRTGVMLSIDLPAFFWKPLVGIPLTVDDLKDIDHSLYTGVLKFMKGCTREDLEGETRTFFEKFQVTLSNGVVVPLKPNGENIDVTWANRDEYIALVEKERLNESRIQSNAIRKGIADVIPIHLLNLCTWQDLEMRVCGKPFIDIDLLKRHTEYSNVSPQAPYIKYFWQVLRGFSQEDRRAFVRFAWAQERLPANDQEFERTQTRMLIKPALGLTNPDQAFPKADTCFFNLMLPEYSSAEIMRQRLLFAIHTDADSMDADTRQQDEDERVARRLAESEMRDFM